MTPTATRPKRRRRQHPERGDDAQDRDAGATTRVKLTPTARRVHAYFEAKAVRGRVTCSIPDVATELDAVYGSVLKALRRLTEAGLLSREGTWSGTSPSTYTLLGPLDEGRGHDAG